uniref:Uncharacterized protein n=1 Tax=Vespula pensylvanica TaxID=30213 RepID=A0A834NSU5_VESPE|nr:hypothetical protein H0235_011630 [Vespula pensylvanica]
MQMNTIDILEENFDRVKLNQFFLMSPPNSMRFVERDTKFLVSVVLHDHDDEPRNEERRPKGESASDDVRQRQQNSTIWNDPTV